MTIFAKIPVLGPLELQNAPKCSKIEIFGIRSWLYSFCWKFHEDYKNENIIREKLSYKGQHCGKLKFFWKFCQFSQNLLQITYFSMKNMFFKSFIISLFCQKQVKCWWEVYVVLPKTLSFLFNFWWKIPGKCGKEWRKRPEKSLEMNRNKVTNKAKEGMKVGVGGKKHSEATRNQTFRGWRRQLFGSSK